MIGRKTRETAAERVGKRGAKITPVDDTSQEPGAGNGIGQRLPEELSELHHLHIVLPKRVDEDVVLLASPLRPGDIVEEQCTRVGRCHALQLPAWAVQDTRRKGSTSESIRNGACNSVSVANISIVQTPVPYGVGVWRPA